MILIRVSKMAFFKVHPQEFTEMYRELAATQHSVEGDGDVFLDLLAEHEAQGHDVTVENSAYAEMYGLVQYPGHEVRYWLNPTR
jgi:hypothetical protein